MKKLFLIAFTALLSASCYSQQKDTVALEKVPLMSYETGMKAITEAVSEIPTKYGDEVRQKMLYIFQQLAAQYKQKQTTGKPKK